MFNTSVIIAGGHGTRMKPITDYVPKPLVMVNNKPLIDYVIDFLREGKINNIHVTYGYKGDLLTNYIQHKVSSLVNTTNQDNSYFLFNSVIKHIDEPIIVCPCDMITNINLTSLYKEYISLGEPIACLVPVKTKLDADTIFSENNCVTKISRKEKGEIYASGIQILNPKKINETVLPNNNFYDVWNTLIEKKLLKVTPLLDITWKIFDKPEDLINDTQNID